VNATVSARSPISHIMCAAAKVPLPHNASSVRGPNHRSSEACIEDILANSELEAMPLGPTAGITADSDTLNPAFAPDGFESRA
jgi:hypothetical protein